MSAKTRLWILVTSGLCLIIVALGVVAGMLPQFERASSIRLDADAGAVLVDTQRGYLTRLAAAEEDLGALTDELRALERALPVTSEWSQFLAQLAALEAQSGAVLAEVVAGQEIGPLSDDETGDVVEDADVQGAAAAAGLTEIPLTIVVTGTADQVARYFALLQTGERLVAVRSVDLSGDPATTLGTLEGSIFFGPV